MWLNFKLPYYYIDHFKHKKENKMKIIKIGIIFNLLLFVVNVGYYTHYTTYLLGEHQKLQKAQSEFQLEKEMIKRGALK